MAALTPPIAVSGLTHYIAEVVELLEARVGSMGLRKRGMHPVDFLGILSCAAHLRCGLINTAKMLLEQQEIYMPNGEAMSTAVDHTLSETTLLKLVATRASCDYLVRGVLPEYAVNCSLTFTRTNEDGGDVPMFGDEKGDPHENMPTVAIVDIWDHRIMYSWSDGSSAHVCECGSIILVSNQWTIVYGKGGTILHRPS